jgi:hypothetical protein
VRDATIEVIATGALTVRDQVGQQVEGTSRLRLIDHRRGMIVYPSPMPTRMPGAVGVVYAAVIESAGMRELARYGEPLDPKGFEIRRWRGNERRILRLARCVHKERRINR